MLTAGVLLFPRVEVLDFSGPFEVLSKALRDNGEPCFTAVTVGTAPKITCEGGLVVCPHHTLDNAPELDVVVVPGGPGARIPSEETLALMPYLQDRMLDAKVIASVCTGSYLLARAGLLDLKRATTHTDRIEDFATLFPAVETVAEKIVDTGEIITAAGVSSGIDLALHLVDRFCGGVARKNEAKRLDGPWQ